MGLIATTWYPMPFEAYAAAIMYAGQASWRGASSPEAKEVKFKMQN